MRLELLANERPLIHIEVCVEKDQRLHAYMEAFKGKWLFCATENDIFK